MTDKPPIDKQTNDHYLEMLDRAVARSRGRMSPAEVESDKRAERPHDNPLTPADVAATVHHCVGITSEQAATLGLGVGGKVIEALF